jgi:mannose-6-phosphate isomerase-like protein (cupin superfamily)
MQTFELAQLLEQRAQSARAYLEFLRVPALSVGIYHLPLGSRDLQQPHTEDEVYYVLSGRGHFWAAGEQIAVRPGTLIFVERAVEHRFFEITENLTVLVYFAPAEGSASRIGATPGDSGAKKDAV